MTVVFRSQRDIQCVQWVIVTFLCWLFNFVFFCECEHAGAYVKPSVLVFQRKWLTFPCHAPRSLGS